jgi:hypothetical protein
MARLPGSVQRDGIDDGFSMLEAMMGIVYRAAFLP